MTNHYMNLRHILLCLCLITGITASAYDAKIDGIYYNFSGDEATVTYQENHNSYPKYTSDYSGDIVIPEAVTYDGKTYSVTSIGDHAFYCSSVTSVNIPNSVTSIGRAAFCDCSGLTSIAIPNSVISIGNDAFAYTGLISVTIPKSVTSIGNYVFSYCEHLTSIEVEEGNKKYDSRNGCNAVIETSRDTLVVGCMNTIIPNNIKVIGNNSFLGCKGLRSITIPEGVTGIGCDAFRSCGLTSIIIPNRVKYINTQAFESCKNLTSVTIGSGVTNIYYSAFQYCSNLTSVHITDLSAWCNIDFSYSTSNPLYYAKHLYLNGEEVKGDLILPHTVYSIGKAAFYGLSELTSVTIPYGSVIGDDAFNGCYNLASVTIKSQVNSIGKNAFADCSSLSDLCIAAWNIPKTDTSSFEGSPIAKATLHVPASALEAYKTTEPWSNFGEIVAFCSEDKVGNLCYRFYEYPEKVAEVISSPDDNKYAGDIAIPSSITYNGKTYNVTSIGVQAFEGCEELTSITIPNSLTHIGEAAFLGCSGLKSVVIPNSIKSIESITFFACRSLTSINIPINVTSIGDYAFYGCNGLTSIIIPESVTYIGAFAFMDCSGLTSITIPGSVETIADMTFCQCYGLTSVTISEGVRVIGPVAFSECYSLNDITIPSSVTSIVDNAFSGCI